MTKRTFLLSMMVLTALTVYLFVSAPAPLPEPAPKGVSVPIERVFALVEAENDAVRALWTKEIVGEGKKIGLKFDEDWEEKDVQAGPLPALFLRETARNLEKTPIRLSLFLGSDFPIRPANRFEGVQLEKFKAIRVTREPEFFYSEDTGRYTAMFSDVAIADPCIECHNEHEESPKNDWRLNDVMGATTWMYPDATVALDQVLKIVSTLRSAFRNAYAAYLAETESFDRRPEIGDKWPRDGYFLPSEDVFMDALGRRASKGTLLSLLDITRSKASASQTPVDRNGPTELAGPLHRASSGDVYPGN